jgi:hypothetical protein
MSDTTHTYTGTTDGPNDSDHYLLVKPDRQPITYLFRVSVDPGGPVDLDWCDIDRQQAMVIIPKIVLPPDARATASLAITVEYETPEPATSWRDRGGPHMHRWVHALDHHPYDR